MISRSSLPRLRTVVSIGCVVLFCTFYWDVITLHRLYSPRHSVHSHVLRANKTLGWTWRCVAGGGLPDMCVRVMTNLYSASSMTLETCTMTCLPGRNIWPQPTGDVKIKRTTASFHPRHLRVDSSAVDSVELSILLKKTTKLYQERITKLAKRSHAQTKVTALSVVVQVKRSTKDYRYRINIDESYKLIVKQINSTVQVTIQASSFLGAHHGLETLCQLIWWDDRELVLKILSSVVITDAPIFTYRGLMLDTAKSFIPVGSILRTIDAMSMNKMNVFHWHLTDSQSFPYASDKYPAFKKHGPYSSKEIYSRNDIKQVVNYAETRAVSVLVEVDAPAHNGQGWDWGEGEGKGNLSLCLNARPFSEFCAEPPCGQLNPANTNSYDVLVQILKELNSLTKSENLMHIGGDDVNFRCWESFGEVTDMEVYMKKGVIGVWELFYENLLKRLAKEKILPKNLLLWSSSLLGESNFWQKLKLASTIVQSRGSSTSGELEEMVKKKFRVIVSSSDTWYLSEPQEWLTLYYHQPWTELSLAERKLVLGGEACAWTERLDRHSLHPWLWPAVAAVAERLWADPSHAINPTDRLAWLRERMVQAGVPSSPVGPKWCLQNPFQC